LSPGGSPQKGRKSAHARWPRKDFVSCRFSLSEMVCDLLVVVILFYFIDSANLSNGLSIARIPIMCFYLE